MEYVVHSYPAPKYVDYADTVHFDSSSAVHCCTALTAAAMRGHTEVARVLYRGRSLDRNQGLYNDVCVVLLPIIPSPGRGSGSWRGRRGLVWESDVTKIQWRRGTREGGGQWALRSAAVSPTTPSSPSSPPSKRVKTGCLLRTPTHSTVDVTRNASTLSPYTCTQNKDTTIDSFRSQKKYLNQAN